MDLQGKVVVITGASSGLGLSVAELAVQKGAKVYGLARRKDRLDSLGKELGAGFTAVSCDVAVEDQVKASVSQIVAESGRIDVLINNAGIGRFGKIDQLETDDWDQQMETNLRGVFLCTRAVVPIMKRQNAETGFGGHIVNIASVAGLIGNPQVSAYNVTKFGLRGMSEALMKELRSEGIKVSCIYPGSIRTQFFEVAGIDMTPNPMTADDVARTILHVVEASDNYLISEVVMRPLRPRGAR